MKNKPNINYIGSGYYAKHKKHPHTHTYLLLKEILIPETQLWYTANITQISNRHRRVCAHNGARLSIALLSKISDYGVRICYLKHLPITMLNASYYVTL